MVVSYLAVLIGLSGTAAALPGTDSVRSDDIINGEVKARDLADSSVGSEELRDLEVTTAQIQFGSVTEEKILDDAVGSNEIRSGAVTAGQLESNALGASEFKGTIQRSSAAVNVPGGTGANSAYDTENASVSCQGAETAVAGGLIWPNRPATDDQELTTVYARFTGPASDPTGFTARGGNDSGTDQLMVVRVLCLPL